jgi:membrane protein DedA with SNARE-associated domain
MPWRKFTLFNSLGAAIWVTAICAAGYLFGGHSSRLVRDLKRFDLAVVIAVVLAILLWWWRSRSRRDSL